MFSAVSVVFGYMPVKVASMALKCSSSTYVSGTPNWASAFPRAIGKRPVPHRLLQPSCTCCYHPRTTPVLECTGKAVYDVLCYLARCRLAIHQSATSGGSRVHEPFCGDLRCRVPCKHAQRCSIRPTPRLLLLLTQPPRDVQRVR